MSEWKEYRLGDLITLNYGKSLPERNRVNGNIPVYSSAGITGWHNKALINSRGIIIGRKGTIGKVHKTEVPFFPIDTCYYILPNEDKYDFDFLYYLLLNLNLAELNEDSAVPGLNRETAYSQIIKLPPLPEQRAIASVLSSLDDKIDLLHRQNRTLEQMAETLFRQWFVEEAKEDWEETQFGSIVQPKKGKNITKKQAVEGEYPVVAGGLEPSCYHNVYNTDEPVVTISASGANAGYVRLYTTKVWSSDSSFIDYSVTPFVYFSYIFLKINQAVLFDKQTGSAQPHIYPVQIMEIECFNYPRKLIEKFENWCKPIFGRIKYNQKQIRTLEKLRDTLLPKLMSGEMRVKNG